MIFSLQSNRKVRNKAYLSIFNTFLSFSSDKEERQENDSSKDKKERKKKRVQKGKKQSLPFYFLTPFFSFHQTKRIGKKRTQEESEKRGWRREKEGITFL